MNFRNNSFLFEPQLVQIIFLKTETSLKIFYININIWIRIYEKIKFWKNQGTW